MQAMLIAVHLLVVVVMIGFILLQKSEGGGLGIGSTGGFMTSRGTANVLSRTTAILAIVFFATSLGLNILAGFDRKPSTIVPAGGPAGAPSAPAAPNAPSAPQGGGMLD